MADYYPLLARALDALPDRSPALRKAVYDRARSALVAQLRSLDPPVAEADIDHERKALDTAIERLEAGYGVQVAEPQTDESGSSEPEPAQLLRPDPETPPPTDPSPDPQPELPDVRAESWKAGAKPTEPAGSPQPADSSPPLPEPTVAETLPEAGPPPDFAPFVPPPRKAKPDAAAHAVTESTSSATDEVETAIPPPEPTAAARRPRIDVVAPRPGRSRLLRNALVGGILVVVIGLIAVAAFMLRDRPAELPPGGDAEASRSEQADTKFADRVGGGTEPERRSPPGQQPQADVTIAQRAILYDENVSDPRATPKTTQGRAIWRLESVSGEQGQPLQSVVRATVDYPDTGFSLVLTIRRNLDATLPASHTIELAFTGQSDERTVQEVGLPQLKDDQNGRGATVIGLPVRVRDNLFLIGLSNAPNDIERNTELLTHKNWIDIGVRFKSGPRGVLSFDKGGAGTQAVQAAFDQWKQ